MSYRITSTGGDTPNIFIWDGEKLIAKLWIYLNLDNPDGLRSEVGRITYRLFNQNPPTLEIELLKIYGAIK